MPGFCQSGALAAVAVVTKGFLDASIRARSATSSARSSASKQWFDGGRGRWVFAFGQWPEIELTARIFRIFKSSYIDHFVAWFPFAMRRFSYALQGPVNIMDSESLASRSARKYQEAK